MIVRNIYSYALTNIISPFFKYSNIILKLLVIFILYNKNMALRSYSTKPYFYSILSSGYLGFSVTFAHKKTLRGILPVNSNHISSIFSISHIFFLSHTHHKCYHIIKLYCHFIFKEEHFSWKSNANFNIQRNLPCRS